MSHVVTRSVPEEEGSGPTKLAFLLAIFPVFDTASSALTNEQCSPYTVHYAYDTTALAKGTGNAVVKAGGKSWFFLTADYAFGHSLEKDTSDVVKASGGGAWRAAPGGRPARHDRAHARHPGSGCRAVARPIPIRRQDSPSPPARIASSGFQYDQYDSWARTPPQSVRCQAHFAASGRLDPTQQALEWRCQSWHGQLNGVGAD